MDCVSIKIVLNRSVDLYNKIDSKKVLSLKKETDEIKIVKNEWNKKMRALEKKGYSDKEILNTKRDNTKISDLNFLKDQIPAGPFTNKFEIQNYMDDASIPHIIKNKRM